MINWQINVYDLLAIIGAALLLYGRLVKLETKVDPLWDEFVQRRERIREKGQVG